MRRSQTTLARWSVDLRGARRAHLLRSLLSELRDQGPSAAVLERLTWAWGNPYSPSPEYLAESALAVQRTNGPLLECGSGLSTLVLGIEAERAGVELVALEHDPAWAKRTRSALKRHGIEARVFDTPLRRYDDFYWYDVPSTELPERFGLVVCDGPPAKLCGRYGLLPVLGDRLRGEILLDDARRAAEADVLSRWQDEFGISWVLAGTDDGFARIRGQPHGFRRGVRATW